MILNEFTSNGARTLSKLTRALEENYDYSINFNKMTEERALRLAEKARAKVDETKDLNKRIKYSMIAESLDTWLETNVVVEGIDDDSMEEAKVILAARELSDKIQGMIEDAAKMQVQDLLPIVDAMKTELGSAEADAFADAADQALSNLVETLKSSKEEYDDAISVAQGEAPKSDMDDFELGGDDETADMEVDMDAMDDEETEFDDEFSGDETEIGGDEPTGRELKDED